MATDHDSLREQAELYVLGALEASERAAFEAHLATCASCAADVRALSTVAGALARTVPITDPPPALRARVLESIGGAGFGGTVAGSVSVRRKPDTASAFAPWLAAAASLALAVGLAVYAAQLRGRIGTLETRLRDAMARVDASERQIADARRAVAEAQSQVAVLSAPDLVRIDLAGQPVAPSASARALWSRSRGLVFTASNLPQPPGGRTYQLWVLTSGSPINAGVLLRPDAGGRISAVINTPVDLPQPTGMAVSIEPEGVVPAPTGDLYLVGQAPAP